jgi:hypothetical protein
MLYVQEDWRVRGSSSSLLRRGFYFVEYFLQLFRGVLGYAQMGYRLSCLLMVLCKAKECCSVEKWLLFASFGVYGVKKIIGVLRIVKVPWRRFYSRFTILCTFGLRLVCTLCHIVLMIFLFAFLVLFRYFLCTLLVY